MKRSIISVGILAFIFVFSGIIFFLSQQLSSSRAPQISLDDKNMTHTTGIIELIDIEDGFMIMSSSDPREKNTTRRIAVKINFLDDAIFEEQKALSKDNVYYGLTELTTLDMEDLRVDDPVSIKYIQSDAGLLYAVYVLRGNLFLQ